ncbi:MAG: hypothetical protein JMN24_16440, partial [gamma proteobacterium endosymbiont of Lamellibrachia anaximandri]|nr:hypothetical protein [gamma proteobacterium endosymbiont of Lamellibrachia anaximandri]
RSDAYFASPLAQGTPGKQCGLAATGDYQPSLRSPWLAAVEGNTPCAARNTNGNKKSRKSDMDAKRDL